ncbi:MAG: type II toxin-antitoxin system VapC family toxin [Gammaproteobacteria bacterium]
MVEVQEVGNGMQILPVTLSHISALSGLPQLHGDPFDRLLIAQATVEQAQVVSSDSWIKHYPVDVIW